MPVVALVVETELPVDLLHTLGGLRRGGSADPCVRIDRSGVWRATRYRSGAATMHLRSLGRTRVAVDAWGPGADEALAAAPALVGATDGDGGLASSDRPLVRHLARRLPGLRMSRTGNAMEAIVPTILEQRVQGRMARRSFCAMVRAAGMSAPAAAGRGAPQLLLQPTAEWLAGQPAWAWHRWNVEQARAKTIRAVATYAHRVSETAGLPVDEAVRRLRLIPGVGVWTAAEVAMFAFGDPDAVSVGDYWMKHFVCHALAGEARGTDERMLELLEPWRGQRGRLCRLILAGAERPPRFGPRLPYQQIAAI